MLQSFSQKLWLSTQKGRVLNIRFASGSVTYSGSQPLRIKESMKIIILFQLKNLSGRRGLKNPETGFENSSFNPSKATP